MADTRIQLEVLADSGLELESPAGRALEMRNITLLYSRARNPEFYLATLIRDEY